MTPTERVQAVIDGRRPDRPPVSFWYHFSPDQVSGRAAVEAHLKHIEDYDLDFLKVMNDNPYPHAGRIRTISELASLTELHGDEAEFGRQLELLANLRCRLRGEVLMTTTVFNAWATLRHLVRPPKPKHSPPNLSAAADEPSAKIKSWIAEDEAAVRSALRVIATSLANFARFCLDAGADGVFLPVRDDWVDDEAGAGGLYARLVGPGDLDILRAAKAGRFNMLHICGRAVGFRTLADYPVHVINWADRAAGPVLGDVCRWARPAIAGGVDNLATLPNGTPADCEAEVADALMQAAERPIMITPGCTYDPDLVPPSNLRALCRSVRG